MFVSPDPSGNDPISLEHLTFPNLSKPQTSSDYIMDLLGSWSRCGTNVCSFIRPLFAGNVPCENWPGEQWPSWLLVICCFFGGMKNPIPFYRNYFVSHCKDLVMSGFNVGTLIRWIVWWFVTWGIRCYMKSSSGFTGNSAAKSPLILLTAYR